MGKLSNLMIDYLEAVCLLHLAKHLQIPQFIPENYGNRGGTEFQV